jgi:MinD-like ATPase involved in chromosome partitioning or flagellar assembly
LADAGRPVVVADPDSPASLVLRQIAEQLQAKTAGRSVALPILRG